MAGNGRNDPGERLFTLPQLAEMSSVDYRTLHNWQKRGMLRPSHREASGSGTASLFDEADALQVLILADLRQGGVEVRVLERVASKIRELAETSREQDLLLIAEETIFFGDIGELDQRLSHEGPNVVLSISRARHAVQQTLAA